MDQRSRHKQRKLRLFLIGFGITAMILSFVMIVLNAPDHNATQPATKSVEPLAETMHKQYNDDDVVVEFEAGDSDTEKLSSPTVAIIIDDFGPGGTAKLVNDYLSLPPALTWAIIPGYSKSSWIADVAAENAQEVIVHMPMQPNENVAMDERDMLMSGMSREEVHSAMQRAMGDVPNAIGMNNHMGSKATKDSALMQLLAEELEDKGMIFIDSQTVPHSYAYRIMQDAGVPALKRHIFLDNSDDSLKIVAQFEELIELAKRKGWAIGIGHARRVTFEVLSRKMPEQIAAGISFVSVGKLCESVRNKSERSVKLPIAAR